MKNCLILLLIMTGGIQAGAQNVFYQDVRIDTFTLRKIKEHIDTGKAWLKTSVHNDSVFLWDRTGSFAQQATLYNIVDLSSYDLLSANLIFTDKDQAQKVVLSPFRLSSLGAYPFLANIKLNFALKDKITTIGFGFGGDNSSPLNQRSVNLAKKFDAMNSPRQPNVGETFEDYKKNVLDSFDASLDDQLLRFDEARVKNVIKWTLGYNVQLFPVLFASGSVNGFDTVNYYAVKAHNFSGAFTYARDNNRWIFTCSYNQIFQRSAAVKDQKVVPYYGPSVSGSARVFSFVNKSKLRTLDVYKKSLFVPSVNVGLSWEGKYADGAAEFKPYYQDKTEKISVFTPFLDILIAPAAQFRIAFPITKTMFPDATEQMGGGASLQYNLKLSNLGL